MNNKLDQIPDEFKKLAMEDARKLFMEKVRGSREDIAHKHLSKINTYYTISDVDAAVTDLLDDI